MIKTKEKELFDLVLNIGEGVHDGFHIYQIGEEDGTEYRCDLGENGSFEIKKEEGFEDFDDRLRVWFWNEETNYSYRDWHESIEEYPELQIDKAIKLMS